MNARQARKIVSGDWPRRHPKLLRAFRKMNSIYDRLLYRKRPITIHFPDGSKIEFIGQFQRPQPLVFMPYETTVTIEVVDA